MRKLNVDCQSLSSSHQPPVHSSLILKITHRSIVLHLICGTSFLLLLVFLIGLVRHHHPTLLSYHALTLLNVFRSRLKTSFLARDAFVKTNRRAIIIMFVCLSVCPSGRAL